MSEMCQPKIVKNRESGLVCKIRSCVRIVRVLYISNRTGGETVPESSKRVMESSARRGKVCSNISPFIFRVFALCMKETKSLPRTLLAWMCIRLRSMTYLWLGTRFRRDERETGIQVFQWGV